MPTIRLGISHGRWKLKCQGKKVVGPTETMGKWPSSQDVDGPLCVELVVAEGGHGAPPYAKQSLGKGSRTVGSSIFLTPRWSKKKAQ